MEQHGWGEHQKEGIQELINMSQSRIFSTKPVQLEYLQIYIELYKQGKADDIKASAFFRTDQGKKNNYERAYKGVAGNMKNLRLSFIEYYETEGKDSEFEVYFIAEEGDYRLGVRQKIKEPVLGPAPIQQEGSTTRIPSLTKIKARVLDFLKIFGEAYVSPKNLAIRSAGDFKWDTLFIFLFSVFILVSMSYSYFDSFKNYVGLLGINPLIKNSIIDQFDKTEKPIHGILSFQLLFSVFRFTVLYAIGIPWLVYTYLFKGRATVSEITNYQFYFIWCWSPLLAWISYAAVSAILHRADISLLGTDMLATVLIIFMLWKQFRGLAELSGFTWKKSVPAFMIYLPVYLGLLKML